MIYADHNATVPLLPEVRQYLAERLEKAPLANPNAIHSLGRKVRAAMEHCRTTIARILGARTDQVLFNSGASEGISHVLHHHLSKRANGKKRLLTSPLEHKAVISALNFYADRGYELEYLPVALNGYVDPLELDLRLKQCAAETALVTLMAANNETGVLQPFDSYARICREHDVPFFSDTCQLIGKREFNFSASDLDFAVISGHKLGALPGSGMLLVQEPRNLTPFIFGAGQELGLRGGTQNYLGNETLAVALEAFENHIGNLDQMQNARLCFENELQKRFPQVVIAGDGAPRLPNTTLVAYPGLHGQAVQIELESREIFVTTSSACSDNEPRTSEVLQAMGISDDAGRGMIRISVGYQDYEKDYEQILEALTKSYRHLEKIKSY